MSSNVCGIILCGGTGSRLAPLTSSVNKHLLGVGSIPMVFHSVNKLVKAGIKRIAIVTSLEHGGMLFQTLGDGSRFGCKFTYFAQEKPDGIAGAIVLCRDFCSRFLRCVVVLGDNIFEDDIPQLMIHDYGTNGLTKAYIALAAVDNPTRFGNVSFSEDGSIAEIVEKPPKPLSRYAVVGLYSYPVYTLFDTIENLEPSARNELEITDVNNFYLRMHRLAHVELGGFWSDAGTHDSYRKANEWAWAQGL